MLMATASSSSTTRMCFTARTGGCSITALELRPFDSVIMQDIYSWRRRIETSANSSFIAESSAGRSVSHLNSIGKIPEKSSLLIRYFPTQKDPIHDYDKPCPNLAPLFHSR